MLVLATPTAQAEQQQRTQENLVTRYDRILLQHEAIADLVGLKKETCPSLRKAIRFYRGVTWDRQDFLGETRSPTYYPERRKHACSYKRFVLGSWQGQARAYRDIVFKLADPDFAIMYVFGPHYGPQAKIVSACESGDKDGDLSPHVVRATNGQYLGMFQMGDFARSTYGHGSTPYQQVLAAYAYFVASGRDWSPWSCKPYR